MTTLIEIRAVKVQMEKARNEVAKVNHMGLHLLPSATSNLKKAITGLQTFVDKMEDAILMMERRGIDVLPELEMIG